MLRTFTLGEWQLVLDAYGVAGQALNYPACRQAITDNTVSQPPNLPGSGDPRDVLRDIFTRGRTTHATFGYGTALPPQGTSTAILNQYTSNRGIERDTAGNAFAAAGIAEHPSGYVRLLTPFFNQNIVGNLLWGPGGAPQMSDEWTRALILLHEIKHIITGDYSSTHDIPFNTRIYNDGLKKLKLK